MAKSLGDNGAPEEIRTPNLLIRSQMLYPVELRARIRRVRSSDRGHAPADGAGIFTRRRAMSRPDFRKAGRFGTNAPEPAFQHSKGMGRLPAQPADVNRPLMNSARLLPRINRLTVDAGLNPGFRDELRQHRPSAS
jgi:hypothetical protein